MKKIGILLNSTTCNKYIYETVHAVFQNDKIELIFLINKNLSTKRGLFKRFLFEIKLKGLMRIFELILYKNISIIEAKVLSFLSKKFSEKLKEHCSLWSLTDFTNVEITYLNPIFSKSQLLVRYSKEDIDKIKLLNLDLIVRGNASGIFKGDILTVAKDGIISFHHGDNRWNRGSPPAFWEVYLRKPSTGFIIQILNEDLDGGSVIFRGNIPTKRSYTENIINLLSKSNPYMAKIILDYVENNKLPVAEERVPFGGKILMVPSIKQSISYFIRTNWLFLTFAIKQIILKKDERWSVAFIKSPWQNAILRKGIKIKNPPQHFYADPFVCTRNNKTVCYVEDYCYKRKRGYITAIELIDDKNYKILGAVIEEPFHMSFPFVFEYKNELYMVPETHEANSIRLYKCIEYPLKWVYQKDILNDICVVDTIIFEYEGRWWLLCNGQKEQSSTLLAFYSDNPLSSNWIPHKLNPLVFDSMIGRNGGILNTLGKSPIRVRQIAGFNQYGKGFTLSKINQLTPDSFHEEKIAQITPDFFENIKGCHHMHSNGQYTVYDYVREESIKK